MVSAVTDNIANTIPSGNGANMGTMVLMIVLSFLVLSLTVYVIIHLIRMFNKTDLKTVTLLKKPVRIPKGDLEIINEDVDMPSKYNGNEYSYSIWFYVDTHQQTDRPKLLLYHGNHRQIRGDTTPIFYMSPDYIELNVMVRTNDKLSTDHRSSLKGLHEHRACDYIKLNVPYVPMQRWVNAILVVDNDYVQLFLDGELRKVVDVTSKELIEQKDDEYGNPTKPITCDARFVGEETNGNNLYIGKLLSDEVVDGFISKVQIFNYAVTMDHAKIIYQSGPLHLSILSMLGLPMYGIRNPFYKIDSDQDVEDASNDTDKKDD
jgi:hypothetical protein